jgi:CRP/FNR family transcriptional regulator, cyclic AMP receptor protein
MTKNVNYVVLRRRGWLSGVPDEFGRDLVSRGAPREADTGEYVHRAGNPQDGLRGIVSGAFAIEMAPFERGPNLLHLFRPGDWMGEIEMIKGLPNVVSVKATRPSAYIHIATSDIEELALANPETWRWIGSLAADHLMTAMGIMDDLTIRDPSKRIAALLLRLAGVRSIDNCDDLEPEIDTTQFELSHLSTLSRATIAGHLDRFERAGLITRSYGRVKLTSSEKLRRYLATY